jgi:hypothetical protein
MTNLSSWVEIACDESGFSGTNLLDPASPVITHASVDLAVPAAADLVAVLHAHVHLIDKTGYVAARVLELFTEEPSYADGTSLGRDHSEAVQRLRKHPEFLAAFVEMTRTKRLRLIHSAAIDRFFATMPSDLPALREVTRGQVEAMMLRLIDDDPTIPPPLEPLVPALAETLLFWSAGERSVAVVHDEQSALTRGRVTRLGELLAEAVAPAPPPLRSFTRVDSRDDPRVQVADLLAGIARRQTPELAELLEPYLCAATKSSHVRVPMSAPDSVRFPPDR